MAFQKYHGITLANNSWIENLHVEKLAADPMPITASRIWHNTTERTLKFSLLDAGGAVIVRTISTAEDLTAAIGTLQAAIDAETAARQSADQTETDARVAAVASLQSALDAEIAARTQAISDEQAARIAADQAEETARIAGDATTAATASDQLNTETTARLAGDAALNTRIDGVQAELDASQLGAGLNVDGTFTTPENTTYLAEATSLKDAAAKLDAALTTEVARAQGTEAALQSALNNEAQLRADGDANLQAQIQAYIDGKVDQNTTQDQAEAAARIAADAALQSELDQTQASIGLDTDGKLIPISGTNYMDGASTVFGAAVNLDLNIKRIDDAVAAESVARATADTNFQNSLNTEITNRQAVDDAQQQEINTIEAGAGLETDGTYASPTDSNYLNTAVSLKDADYKLDAAVKGNSDQIVSLQTTTADLQTQLTAEVQRAQAAESTESTARAQGDATNAAAITAEQTRAQTAETGLQAAIDQEVSDRTAAVTATNTALSNEVTRAQAAEAALQTSIGDETTRAQGAEASLQSQINSLSAAAGEGASALKTELNEGRFTYKSASAALVHNINHNLNTEFYTVQVMVQGTDGVYRNDIVPVEEVAGNATNAFVITLTEAHNIKVSVMNLAPLA